MLFQSNKQIPCLDPQASIQIDNSHDSLWQWPEKSLSRCSLMGIINVTPDSFYDGGRLHHQQQKELIKKATEQGLRFIEEGALYLDIGGESSRPGAEPVSDSEELDRVLPVIEALIKEQPKAIISIDTVKPAVASAALNSGALIINDISGLRNPKMRYLAAQKKAGVVIMHMRGTPRTMQKGNLHADDIVNLTYHWLQNALNEALKQGLKKEQISIDIGIGFGKTVSQNLLLIKHLNHFLTLDCHLLVGISRKSFIGALSGDKVNDRLPGSLVAMITAMKKGGKIFRVHDVAESRQALIVAKSLEQGEEASPPLSLYEYLRLIGG